jgi:hypothetical protein
MHLIFFISATYSLLLRTSSVPGVNKVRRVIHACAETKLSAPPDHPSMLGPESDQCNLIRHAFATHRKEEAISACLKESFKTVTPLCAEVVTVVHELTRLAFMPENFITDGIYQIHTKNKYLTFFRLPASGGLSLIQQVADVIRSVSPAEDRRPPYKIIFDRFAARNIPDVPESACAEVSELLADSSVCSKVRSVAVKLYATALGAGCISALLRPFDATCVQSISAGTQTFTVYPRYVVYDAAVAEADALKAAIGVESAQRLKEHVENIYRLSRELWVVVEKDQSVMVD